MSALNHVVLISASKESAAPAARRLLDEGYTCTTLVAGAEVEPAIEEEDPACVLLLDDLDHETLQEQARIVKNHFIHLPVLLLVSGPVGGGDENQAPVPSVDGICPLELTGAQMKVILQGAIRSAFHIRELRLSNEKLNERSITDSLTGLFNRGYMIDRMNLEFKRASRNRSSLTCLMIDLDHFKQVNDTYGHQFGDVVLQEVSLRLSELIRETDIFGRYGGEEFLILLPNTDLKGAEYLAEKLRHGLESEPINYDCFSLLVTASLGVASTENREVVTADHLLQFSDRALYQAKEAGRNRVCVAGHTAPISEGGFLGVESSADGLSPTHVDAISARPDENRYLQILSEEADYDLRVYPDAESFFEAFRATVPNLLLIDEVHGTSDIAELCRKVKGQLKDLFVPLVVLVASGDEDSRHETLESGADEVVPPGYSARDFLAHLHSMLRLKGMHDRWRDTFQDLKMARTRLIKAERLTALGEMAGGVAHDFNNILSAVLGRTQLLRQTTTDPNVIRNLNVIERAASDGVNTIRRIQEFSRSTVEHAYTILDMRQVIQDCIQMTRTRWKDQAEVAGLRYVVHADLPAGMTVEGSPTELREVFTNFIMNSLDSMPKGGEMTFTGKVEADLVLLQVGDTGHGMDEAVLKRIYDPFFTTKEGEGTGLGLSVAYGILLRHNGRIECTSELGVGTTFRIELPYRPAPAQEPAEPAEFDEKESRTRPIQILVVDDESAIREIFEDVLGQEGHTVHLAASGQEALEIAGENTIELVFTDLSMPEMSGWEVARNVRRINPGATIVLTSGWGKDFNQTQLAQHGVDYVLAKPVPFETLISLAQRVSEGVSIT